MNHSTSKLQLDDGHGPETRQHESSSPQPPSKPPKSVCNNETDNPSNDLQAAVAKNDVECARSALRRKADPDVRDSRQRTPLMLAAEAENLELVTLLIDWKADVNGDANLRDEPSTALAIAISKKALIVAKTLVDAGASLTTPDRGGWLPLHRAVLAGNTEVIELLLSKGAEVDALTNEDQNFLHRTASHLAAAYGKREILEILYAHGSDLNVRNGRGSSVLSEAAHYGEGQIPSMKFILRNAPYLLNARNTRKQTPLFEAMYRERNHEAITLLLDAGADPLIPSDSGTTALDAAKLKGYDGLVREYLPPAKRIEEK